MTREAGKAKSSHAEPSAAPEKDALKRKPYAPPRLQEYGTVAKLTQGAGGSVIDAIFAQP